MRCQIPLHLTSHHLDGFIATQNSQLPRKKAWFATTLGLTRVRLTLRCMANFVIKVLDQSERVYAVRDAL